MSSEALAAYVGNERSRARGPAWVPAGALAAWDFANGRFWRAAYTEDAGTVTITLCPSTTPHDVTITDTNDAETVLTDQTGTAELPVELASLKTVIARRA